MTCKLCGTSDLRLFYTQGRERQFHFYRCPRCRLVIYDTSAGVNQEKYILHGVDPRAPTRQNRGHRQTYAFIERHVAQTGNGRRHRMLDLGCGDGTVLWLAREDGWIVKGIELFPEHTRLVRETLGLDVETSDITSYDGTNESWDCVVLTHVLEHLPDPVGALRKIRNLLTSDGAAVLEFPNIDAFDAKLRRLLERLRLHRRRYAASYVPGHVQEFCRASFAYAAQEAGLEVIVWETYAVNPLQYALFRAVPIGNKARVLVKRAGTVHA
jgi:2-polyprenyl-3-methyl-5-hydroxy-6-metoxy-1,4-benzoquinol methylase